MAEQTWGNKFIGRDDELRQLGRALDAVRNGEPRTVVIGGEAGVGKSRLVAQVLEHGLPPNVSVISAACIDCGDSPLPFGPIVDALRSFAATVDDETRERLVEPVRALLDELLPRLEGASSAPLPVVPGAAAGSRQQLFEMVLALLEGVSAHGPVVVVLEDLHWADRSTRDLLAFLVPNLARVRVALVLTYRSDELVQGHELLRYFAQLQRNRGVVRVYLRRFGREELAAHLDDVGGAPVGSELVQSIWERSQGNPFYAEELLASAAEGSVERLPTNLNDILLSRLRSLSPDTQTVLRMASVGGRVVDERLLAEVVDTLPGDRVRDALREAAEHEILVEEPGSGALTFRHALLQEVAYADLLPGERRAAHARFGANLAAAAGSRGPSPFVLAGSVASELARHHFHAGNDVEALAASLDAADVAEQARGYAESHVHLERALLLWDRVVDAARPTGLERVDLLDRCAQVSHLEGDDRRAVQLARDGFESAQPGSDRRRGLAARLGCYLAATGEGKDALAVHAAAVAEVEGAEPSPVHAEVLNAYAQTLQAAARHFESAEFARRALDMARAVGDRSQEAQALKTLGSNLVIVGDADAGVADLRRSLAVAEELGRPLEIASGYRDLAATLSGPLNRLEEGLAVATEGAERVRAVGLERHWGVSLRSMAADTLFRMGRWDEADALVGEAIRATHGIAVLDFLLARVKIELGRGRLDDAETDLDRARALAARAIDLRYRVPIDTLDAGLALWRGDVDAARRAVEAGLNHVRETDDVWFLAPLVWHGMRAEAERAARARASFDDQDLRAAVDAAESLRARSLDIMRSGRQAGALRAVVDAYDSLCEGEVRRTRGEAAAKVWRRAAETWGLLGQPYPTAYAQWRCAEAELAVPKGAVRATPYLRAAYATALELRAEPLRDELARLAGLARIPLEEPGPAPEVVDVSGMERLAREARLTKREVQVLDLVAEGATNREIAGALFISESTVSVHVTNILGKLHVGSRVQAARMVHQLPD